jgi:hypothetical protein
MIEHRSKILVGTFEEVEVFLGFPRGGKKAPEADGVVGEGATVPNVSTFVSVLDVFGGPPRVKLSEGRDACPNGKKCFDGASGAEKKFKVFDAFTFGLGSCGECCFGCVDGTPFDEVGELFSRGPWKRRIFRQGKSGKKKDEKKERGHFSRAVFAEGS